MSDTTAPTPPALYKAVAIAPTHVSLSWTPGYDAVGITAYKVYRDGSSIITLGVGTEYVDPTVSSGTTYVYKIAALDAALNESNKSNAISVTTPGVAAISNPLGTVQVDFGTTPVADATFTVTDASVTVNSHIIAQVAWEAPTGKDIDEIEMDDIILRCQPGAGQFFIFAHAADGSYLHDKFRINYLVR